jgi:hypothetical protein
MTDRQEIDPDFITVYWLMLNAGFKPLMLVGYKKNPAHDAQGNQGTMYQFNVVPMPRHDNFAVYFAYMNFAQVAADLKMKGPDGPDHGFPFSNQ